MVRRLSLLALLAALVGPALVAQAPPALDPLREFPSYDTAISTLLRQGAATKQANAEVARGVMTPASMAILVRQQRYEDILRVLPASLTGDVERTIEILRFLSTSALIELRQNDGRGILPRLRAAIEPVRARLQTLPREQAARLAQTLATVDSQLSGEPQTAETSRERTRRFIEVYRDTETARVAEVDLLGANDPRNTAGLTALLDTYWREHPGTIDGARALYRKASTIQPPGLREPASLLADRLLERIEIVKELESGRYPPNRSVTDAPGLIVSWFYSTTVLDRLDRTSIDRMLVAYEDFVTSHLRPGDIESAENAIGHVIAAKMGDLYARRGEAVTGVERFLDRLEKTAADPAAIRLYRGAYYLREATQGPQATRTAVRARAREAYSAVADEGRGSYSRKALATVAALDFHDREYARAVPVYQRFIGSYPESQWAWVARLRMGQCYDALGDKQRAIEEFERVAAVTKEPVAVVLGRSFAARADDALGRFDRALAASEGALKAWDPDYGLEYAASATQAPVTASPMLSSSFSLARIRRDDLSNRVAVLRRVLPVPVGTMVERGRWQFDQGRFAEAYDTLADVLQRNPQSSMASEVRALMHRAELEKALDLASIFNTSRNYSAAEKALEAIRLRETFDFTVTSAGLANAAVITMQGREREAWPFVAEALRKLEANQQARATAPPATPLDADLTAIRSMLLRPLGDLPLISGPGWNAFRFPAVLPPFVVVNADVEVKQASGEVVIRPIYQRLPGVQHTVFLTRDEFSQLERIITVLGGTETRRPVMVMETPNIPVGGAADIVRVWNQYFPARAGHWSGWVLQTYPFIRRVEFLDEPRTKANVSIEVGFSGATVVMEKVDGEWKALRLTNQWIT